MDLKEKKIPRFSFSGHDTFACRQFWPKKGYDFVKAGKSFNSEDAVIDLGVGKNMVAAIRYWMRAMDLLTVDDELTPLATKLLDDNGWDPYLEDETSLWLLHYHLVKKGAASSYYLIFNELRKEKIEFNKESYAGFIKRKADLLKNFQASEKTIFEDFSVFSKMYLRTDNQVKEDIFLGLFTELDLMRTTGKKGDEQFVIENKEREELPEALLLYIILNNKGVSRSVSVSAIEQEANNLGSVLALSRTGIANKLDNIAKKYDFVVYSDHAGIKEVQFKEEVLPLDILNKYYAN
nr:DUF4007 family protein [Mucilaginibacter sp. SP1R1]MBB6150010.1 hypothetical protein [Mucilaginibacter sp. SP1R1]